MPMTLTELKKEAQRERKRKWNNKNRKHINAYNKRYRAMVKEERNER
jgi:predicted GNAT superfamily acetyltransferase